MENEILTWMRQTQEDWYALRHQLHAYPELGHEEHVTTELIYRELRSYGAAILTGRYGTGVVALIEGARPGETIALREDMDALPMEETTKLPYASRREGIAHACGHDIHTVALLACARYLCDHKAQLAGRVMLIFQCAEECCDGAFTMLEGGLFETIVPNRLFGFHCAPQLPLGTVGICRGAANASCDIVKLQVIGRGGHGAHPELCVDPVIMGASLLMQMQTVVSRERDPINPSVLSFGSIHGGTAPNIIPDEIVLEGTLRTFDGNVRARHKETIVRMAEHGARAMGGVCRVSFAKGMPPLINTDDSANRVVRAARKLWPSGDVNENIPPSMGSDDFSCILEACGGEGVQFLVGTGMEEDSRTAQGLHVSSNIFPDEAILTGACMLAQIARDMSL